MGGGRCVQRLKKRHPLKWNTILSYHVVKILHQLRMVELDPKIAPNFKRLRAVNPTVRPIVERIEMDLNGFASPIVVKGYGAVHGFIRSKLRFPAWYGPRLYCSEVPKYRIEVLLKRLHKVRAILVFK